jgi:predicted transcriptional regulator of viral defense system
MKANLEKLFKENGGYLKSDQMKGSTYRYHLNKLIADGKVYKVRHGLYVHTGFQTFDERVLVSAMIPAGVFCLFSAWELYELSTTVPHQYYIALPRNTKVNPDTQLPLAIYYWSNNVYSLGISNMHITDKPVKCYDIERSVCDAVKFRNKTGDDVMQEVLKNYMNKSNRNLDKLLKYATILRIEKVIMPYIKSMI